MEIMISDVVTMTLLTDVFTSTYSSYHTTD